MVPRALGMELAPATKSLSCPARLPQKALRGLHSHTTLRRRTLSRSDNLGAPSAELEDLGRHKKVESRSPAASSEKNPEPIPVGLPDSVAPTESLRMLQHAHYRRTEAIVLDREPSRQALPRLHSDGRL